MKKLSVILLSSVVLALAGCGNQGGSSDQYNTDSGSVSNTSYNRGSNTNDYQGGALSPGRIDSGARYSTNYPGRGTNDQGGGGQLFDAERTNNVPEN